MSAKVRLCEVGDAAPGQVAFCEPQGLPPIAVCNVGGTFYAIEDECTHAIASLSQGRLDGEVIFCPMHGGSFNVKTGQPCSLPCKFPLQTFRTEVADGAVWLIP